MSQVKVQLGRRSTPEWAFQSPNGATPQSGKFTTDNISASLTTVIRFGPVNLAGSDSSWIAAVTVKNLILFKQEEGMSASFTIQNVNNAEDGVTMEVLWLSGEMTWEGNYQIQFSPRA